MKNVKGTGLFMVAVAGLATVLVGSKLKQMRESGDADAKTKANLSVLALVTIASFGAGLIFGAPKNAA